MGPFDIAVAGAGVIGLSCALELQARGLRVVVLERGLAGREASWAAAGMLAAHDPANPPELTALAELSIGLYPEYLARIATLGGGTRVPFETDWVLERREGDSTKQELLPGLCGAGFHATRERSIDPRKLAKSLIEAVRASGITLMEGAAVQAAFADREGVRLETAAGRVLAKDFLDCTGTWSAAPVTPAKGQMLRVHGPGSLSGGPLGNVVVRTPEIYLVPRLDGSVVIGASVEDAGFDRTVEQGQIDGLRRRAAELVPSIADAPLLESWAGLRPDTPDHLPLIGQVDRHAFVAAGHFRNGILLAPGTARVMAQAVFGEPIAVDLGSFAPARFRLN